MTQNEVQGINFTAFLVMHHKHNLNPQHDYTYQELKQM